MIKKILFLKILLLSFVFASAQIKDVADTSKKEGEKITPSILPKPILELGIGMFSFNGELSNKNFANPMVSRVAYDLGISEDLTDYLNLRFYALFGKLGANERGIDRNLNFESSIRLGGVNLTYNFDQLLKKDRIISPYISLGLESFEFLSKTDLRDANGNTYYYWKDGSIKNISEESPNAKQAEILYRDYSYESDLRESNLDKIGKYGERSWAIPIGAGAMVHVSDKLDLKIGTTLHFTFTDNIDNISSKGEGFRQGDSKNDKFLMSSFSLQYHLFGKDKTEITPEEDNANYLASDPDDEDSDGVVDMADYSPFTPKGEPVDARGVPMDDDKDLVFNFRDDEIMSTNGAIVNTKGVEYTDTMMVVEYGMYLDSVGAYAQVVDLNKKTKDDKRDIYKVQLGAYKTGIPPDLINKFLSIRDIQSTKIGDSLTVYTVGKYNNYGDADVRKNSLVESGIKNAAIVVQNKNKLIPVNEPLSKKSQTTKQSTNVSKVDLAQESNEVIFRVQVGAYKGNVSKDIFGDLPQLISFQGENGVTRYVTGNYSSYQEAAKTKIDILLKGFEGAFVVAYKGGKRIALQSIGVDMLQKESIEDSESNKEMNGITKNKIFFAIQIGNFKNDVPADLMNKFVSISDIEVNKQPNGNTRYTVGNYSDYASALFRKNELVTNYKLDGAFIIAFFNGRQIDMNEAKELLNK